MTEFQIRTIIDSLEVKLRKLVMAYTELKDQLKESQKEKELLKKKIIEMERDHLELQKKLNEQSKNFKNSDKFTKIVANNLKNAGDPAELKEKIDEYILEIDKCISQLSV
ncbi:MULTISPECIES: hypothetical protein [Flectobacillus]|jgi:predicted  nucleic acid-binding Zn-ribbon protein|uniref:Uncharacterized protein n=1 Tax=Flectobacillus roseus TaxID=502259 RepID=A0ABT6YAP8_9BACT|nr:MULTISPECIES: hypothetical protein [Flectobacillus]MDI9860657.1 hypothetical protein [Flectobacillus roseus]MDI9869253.1 hypothetical protein [Flectobacillus roseus]NBA74683.1 hypothetical protein [Emticicia sp. ODNR4P]PAC33584.1 hypothetical protein BWI92_00730 [Flectobacillus sp. BAB-3569]